MIVSTRNLAALPAIEDLRKLCQSIALLDAIIEPEWEFRYFSFNSKWAQGETMASMRNAEGDSYHILFCPAGAIMKGIAHETTMASFAFQHGKPWRGVDEVPTEFAAFLTEPAFSTEDASFCIWRRTTDAVWNRGNIEFPGGDDPDGSEDLLFMLGGNPKTYAEWAEEYHEIEVPMQAVQHIYAHRPLTEEIVAILNPERTVEALSEDISEIGYPRTPPK